MPGHWGIQGNQISDEIARNDSSILFDGPELAIGISKILLGILSSYFKEKSVFELA